MKVKVLYFALLRDAMGIAEERVDVPDGVNTVGALRDWLMARGEPASTALANSRRVRAAVNQDMVESSAPIEAGDEVAFFPPVTGG